MVMCRARARCRWRRRSSVDEGSSVAIFPRPRAGRRGTRVSGWLNRTSRELRGSSAALALLLAALAIMTGPTPALAADGTSPTTWAAATPSVFGLGDSLFMQCGETLGLRTRSLDMIGWGSATSTDMRARLTSSASDWPYMTEPSHADELADARDASSWVVGLGTNDVRVGMTAAQYQENVNWFMEQAAGRPVLWFNLYYPTRQSTVATFNGVLAAAAQQWPNLRILDWNGYVTAHPEVLFSDRVHLASFDACRQGRFALIQANIPPVAGDDSPHPDWVDPDPQSPPTPQPVAEAYQRSGGEGGPLGASSGDVTCAHKGWVLPVLRERRRRLVTEHRCPHDERTGGDGMESDISGARQAGLPRASSKS